MSPLIGIQIGLFKEQLNESMLSVNDNSRNISNINHNQFSTITEEELSMVKEQAPSQSPVPQINQQLKQTSQVIFQNETHTVTVDGKAKESVLSVKSAQAYHASSNEALNYVTEEMQLKAAYELQLWKEAREKEFEIQVLLTFSSNNQKFIDFNDIL